MFFEKKNQLLNRVIKLKDFVNDINIENIYENIEDLYNEIKDELTFNVLCLGDFSSGKSTFINKFFIKKDVLPTNVTTTTAKLTILKYGEKEKIVIKYEDNNSKEITENFENILKDTVAKGGNNLENIDYVEIYINSEYLKDGIIIVDSPGLNDPETERMKVTFKYIDRADCVLYLLNGLQAWKRSEKEFLEERILKKEDLDKIFFLLNFWDLISEEQREGLIEYVQEEMKKSLEIAKSELGKDISDPPLIPISSKTCDNFENLKEVLFNYFVSKKGEKILESKYKKLDLLKNKIKELIKESIKIQRKEIQELDDSLLKLKKEIEKLEKEVENFRANLEDKIGLIVLNFIDDIKETFKNIKEKVIWDINRKIELISDANDLEIILKKSFQKAIYIEKSNLNNNYKRFINEVEKIIEQEKSNLALDKYFFKKKVIDIDELKKYISPELNTKGDYIIDAIITGGSVLTAIVLASIANPVVGLLSLGGIAYNIVLKKKREKDQLIKLISDIEEQLDDVFIEQIKNTENKKEEIVKYIIENIRNEIIEAYQEKEKLYKQAVQNKENNEEQKIIKLYEEKMKPLEEI